MAAGEANMTGPLSGIVVADFTRVLAGPYCTMLLADLGADVIKVEGPAGDDTRHWVPPRRDDTGTYYLAINRNKRSIVLDLSTEDNLATAQALSQRADVFIQNFKPGGLVRFGLDYESVRERRPDTIYCSISGFGAGAGAGLPGYDLLAQAVSGLMSLTGSPDGPAYRAGVAVFDVMTGLHSAIGILAALHHRRQTGQGQHVQTNLLSSALSALVNQASAYVAGDVVPSRMGNAHLSLFPYEPLPTGEGDLIVIAGNDAQFRRLAALLGIESVSDDERFATVAQRNANREQLRPILLERLATKSAQEWFDVFSAAGIPCGPINDVRGGVALAARLGLEPVVLAGDMPTVRHPIDFSATPPRYDLAPRRLGEHGEQIREWLRRAT
jgi:crotonobetainyl-CoA:carnitine CoA-transferase CaiB-like acyl-CoA transferase